MRDCYVDVEHWSTVTLMPWTVDGRPNEWIVTGVEVLRSFRGQGWATRLFDTMIADADASDAELILQVAPDWTGLDFDALWAFYARRGFEPDEPLLGPAGMRRARASSRMSVDAASVPL